MRVLIVNPFASGVSETRLEAVQRVLPDDTTTVLTLYRGHATELAREWGPRVEAIYVYSGDGTYNEVLNGLDADVPLGLVPGGGTSVLPRALGLPRDAVHAAQRLAAGHTRRISLGRVNGRRFGFNAGIGFDAELVRRVDALGRSQDGKRPGDVAFVRTALGLLRDRRFRFEPALEIEGLGRAAFVFVANGSVYTYAGLMGLRVAPEATFEGGLDIVAPTEVRPWSLPRFALGAVRGFGDRRVLRLHDVDRATVRCDRPLPLQLDGEDVGDVETAVFEAERDALTVLV